MGRNGNGKATARNGAATAALPLVGAADERLDMPALETWLWDAACAIRGATDAPKVKDYILPQAHQRRVRR
jgi:type I restriction enzyme M protein